MKKVKIAKINILICTRFKNKNTRGIVYIPLYISGYSKAGMNMFRDNTGDIKQDSKD